MTNRLTTVIGGLTLPNPVICGSGEPVMTEAGIRAALAAGAAGVIAKSVNEKPGGNSPSRTTRRWTSVAGAPCSTARA
jgi:dihydroorotate dehydrogenase